MGEPSGTKAARLDGGGEEGVEGGGMQGEKEACCR